MGLSDIKLPIGIIGVIIAQAFGIIWYVAQLDSTVTNLDSSVSQMQEQATTIDIAVLQTDLENLKKHIQMMDEMHSEKFDPTELEEALDEIEDSINALDKRSGIIENEMRTIMSDHAHIGDEFKNIHDVLNSLLNPIIPSTSGYSEDKRQYGSYGQ